MGFEVHGPRGGAGETLRSVLVLWARGRRHVHCLYFVPMLREQGRHLIFLRVRPGKAFLNMPPSIDLNVLLAMTVGVAALCSFVPVRLHVLWDLPAVSFLLLVVSAVSWNLHRASYRPLMLVSLPLLVFAFPAGGER